jgi:hypothetical protein
MGILRRSMMAVAVIGAAGAIAGGGLVPAGAATTSAASLSTVQLPISTYSHMVVDPVHRHLFFTGGAGSTSILVTDYFGNTVATIPDEGGATGLALSGDGSTVYAALSDDDAVSAISTSTLTETARYDTGTGVSPVYVVYTSGKVWFSYNASQSGIGSIDPGTSPATVTLNAVNSYINEWSSAPVLTASANGKLVAGEASQSPEQMASYDVSSGTATALAPFQNLNPAIGPLESLQITPDGNDVVVASYFPYDEQVLKVADLSSDGEYDTTYYPKATAIGADGMVFGGSDDYNTAVYAFAPGNSSPIATYTAATELALDGLAVTPDDSELFVISTDAAGPVLTTIPNLAQVSSTLSVTGPATARHGDTVTFSGTLGGPSAYVGGQTLTVTRIDPSHPNGVTLPSVTTAADGSFSFTDTAPKTTGQDSSTVTYQVSYAGDAHLAASSASASVTVANTGG